MGDSVAISGSFCQPAVCMALLAGRNRSLPLWLTQEQILLLTYVPLHCACHLVFAILLQCDCDNIMYLDDFDIQGAFLIKYKCATKTPKGQ